MKNELKKLEVVIENKDVVFEIEKTHDPQIKLVKAYLKESNDLIFEFKVISELLKEPLQIVVNYLFFYIEPFLKDELKYSGIDCPTFNFINLNYG